MYLPFTSCCHLPCSSCCTFKTLWYISIRHATCHVHSVSFHSSHLLRGSLWNSISCLGQLCHFSIYRKISFIRQRLNLLPFLSSAFWLMCDGKWAQNNVHVRWGMSPSDGKKIISNGACWHSTFWRQVRKEIKRKKRRYSNARSISFRTGILSSNCFYRWPKWW